MAGSDKMTQFTLSETFVAACKAADADRVYRVRLMKGHTYRVVEAMDVQIDPIARKIRSDKYEEIKGELKTVSNQPKAADNQPAATPKPAANKTKKSRT